MTAILGVSAFYHDAAAALVVDGRIIAAAQEERFTRKKHDPDFPQHAIDFCLSKANLTPEQLDYVAFYDKPLLKFERLMETYLGYAPAGFESFKRAIPVWAREKLFLPRTMRKGLKGRYQKRFVFTEHHESHAASAFFPSPYEEAAVLCLDGVGEWATTSYGIGRGNRLELSHEIRFPHSLGLLYSAFTYYTGFRVNSGEYKLMGLAPYGEPIFVDLIKKHLIDIKPDGSFRLNLDYFNYCQGLTMTNKRFDALFGRPPRSPETPVSKLDMDIASSIQKVTEEVMIKLARHVREKTGMKHLCLAGGVALNCVGNGKILRENIFDDIWIQPAAGDAGGALGAALFVWHHLLENPRTVGKLDSQFGSLLGPSYSREEVKKALDAKGAVYHEFTNEEELCDKIGALIASEKVIGFVHGPMEFGPRALGARSIIGDARSETMQSVMNLKIKFRESFRPFAPCVTQERCPEFFEMRPGQESPYMLLVAPVQPAKRTPLNGQAGKLSGLDLLKVKRSEVQAITHVDFSARVQTIDPVRRPRFYKIIKAFERRSGCPVIINTSFNVRGEPIVCTPEDAYRCFMGTNMDVLVVEDFVMYKNEQPNAGTIDNSAYLKQFALD